MKPYHLLLACFLLGISVSAEAVPAPLVTPAIPAKPAIPAPTNTYYVDNSPGVGVDDVSGHGQSQVAPWASLKFAIEQLNPGDKLYVIASGYPYDTAWAKLSRTDTSSDWISIEGLPDTAGDKPVINGRLSLGYAGQGGGADESVHHVEVKGLDFEGAGGSHVNVFIFSGSHDLVFEDDEINCQQANDNLRGLYTNPNVYNVWFKGVYVHECGFQRNVPFDSTTNLPTDCGGICVKNTGITDIVFDNVHMQNNVGDGVSSSKDSSGNFYFTSCLSEGNSSDGYDVGGANVLIQNSISRNNGGHQGVGFKVWAKNVWLVGSVAYNNKYAGVSFKPTYTGGVSTAYIVNNTLAMNSIGRYVGQLTTVERYPEAGGEADFYLYNNIFYSVNASSIVINNNATQFIKGEDYNQYYDYFDPLYYLNQSSQYALYVKDGSGNAVLGESYTFAEMESGSQWSIDHQTEGFGTADFGHDASSVIDPGFAGLVEANAERWRIKSQNTYVVGTFTEEDLSLVQGALAINSAVDMGVPPDMDGNSRAVDQAPDRGAYEQSDSDFDGVASIQDNCPNVANPNQTDSDNDLLGNACDLETRNLLAIAVQDGWLLESASSPGTGGGRADNGAGEQGIRMGDDENNLQYKSILSFDASIVPASANITSATIKLHGISTRGDISSFGDVGVDLSLNGFSGNAALQNGDFEAAATENGVSVLTLTAQGADGEINSVGRSLIPSADTVQFKLQFGVPRTENYTRDTLGFYGADAPDPADRPVLVVNYLLPD